MQTLYLDGINDRDGAIETAAGLLREGRIVAFPTETVYGLGAAVFMQEAVEDIYHAKGRPNTKPIAVLIADIEDGERLANTLPPAYYALAERFMPGPLTMVVQKSSEVSNVVSAGTDSVGIRMPAHSLTLELIRALGQPLAATSANRSGSASPDRAEQVRTDLDGRIAAVLDGGPCELGIASTVVDVRPEVPTILRQGALGAEELSAACGLAIR